MNGIFDNRVSVQAAQICVRPARLKCSFTFLLVSLTGALSLGYASPQPATAIVAGAVIDALDGHPVAGAIVTVRSSAPSPRAGSRPAALTDESGRFVVRAVPAGRVQILASKAGYMSAVFGQRSANDRGQTVDVTDRGSVGGLVIRLWKHAVIAGRVIEDGGSPRVAATVVALRVIGNRLAVAATATTDDRGAYRLWSLSPGQYFVAVPGSRAQLNGRVDPSDHIDRHTTFFPDALSASGAIKLSVDSGEELVGVDVLLRRTSNGIVTGRILGAPAPVIVRLEPQSARLYITELETIAVESAANGTFDAHVPVGDYLLRVTAFPRSADRIDMSVVQGRSTTTMSPAGWKAFSRGRPLPPAPAEPTLWVEVPIHVAEGIRRPIDVQLWRGSRIAGKVVSEGTSTVLPAFPIAPAVAVQPVDGSDLRGVPTGGIDADGTFLTAALPNGTYLLWVMPDVAQLGWTVTSVTVGSRDVLSEGIRISGDDVTGVVVRLTDRRTEISGTIRDERGQPRSDVGVYLFSTDRRRWRPHDLQPLGMHETRPGPTGEYRFGALVPGEYFLAATDALPVEWRDPTFLEALASRAVKVRLAAGDLRVHDLIVR